ncbi:hypothetical protein ERJ75_001283800 [Trypanosoma vivax]|nr:hypothetical protein ERJ75_001283800 [Trypanosoma vivax]
MVDGSVIAEIVEAATRAVMQRMFDGAGQRVCGDGRRNYVSPQKASTPSFVRPMPGAFSGPANAQGQSGNTQGRDNRPLRNKGEMDEQQPTEARQHSTQQQQQQQHKVTWAAVVAQKAPPQQRHRPVPWTPVSAARRTRRHATRGPASESVRGQWCASEAGAGPSDTGGAARQGTQRNQGRRGDQGTRRNSSERRTRAKDTATLCGG